MKRHRLKWFKDNIGKELYRLDVPVKVTKSNYAELYRLQEDETLFFSQKPISYYLGQKRQIRS
jgi:hypothetical protein